MTSQATITLSTKLSPEQIKANLLTLAIAARCHADELDEAFVKHCDPRALQGGAICDEANEWRGTAREIRALASQLEA